MKSFIAPVLLFLAVSASAAEFHGTLRNDKNAPRATLRTRFGDYLLDYGGSRRLYWAGERYDRERVVVNGVRRPGGVIEVDSITFRPYSNRSVTYNVYSAPLERRYYTSYERPRVRRRIVRWYEYR
ncbi:MAG TPA: hypothetical protein VEK08_06125 [Planctomycetota bacterium]|nr:hypothetical protein [Planctomycetota bacterium]